jgi:hypothetical protein
MQKTIAIIVLVIGLAARGDRAAGAAEYGEYEVKAAFLLNFARLVQWPTSAFHDPEEPILLGVLGRDPFDGALQNLVEGRKTGPRTIRVKRIANVREITTCHIVFVSAPEPAPLAEILAAARGASVLLVGDGNDFARKGGAINFYSEAGKIRFAVNRQAAEGAGLKISSHMLRLAKLVPEDSSAVPASTSLSVAEGGRDSDSAAWPRALHPMRHPSAPMGPMGTVGQEL